LSKPLADLTPEPGERVGTFGGSRTGKSALQEWEARTVQDLRPMCGQLIMDSKPRFRAEKQRHPWFPKQRRPAHKLYQDWAAGPTVPNSVTTNIWDDHPFRGLWPSDPENENYGEIVILQGETRQDHIRMLQLAMAFVKAQWKNRERRLIFDETLDYYGRNGYSIDGRNDALYLAARAGGERGIGTEFGAHRVYGIPHLILMQLSRVNLFHLVSDSDMKHLKQTVGIHDAASPHGDFVFRQWVKKPGGTLSEPFTGRAKYPQSYLDQLSAT
jgi:hypothetical protein